VRFSSICLCPSPLDGQAKPRARDLGVPFDGVPGPLNAITDVRGVEVGFSTLIRDDTTRRPPRPVRTGVTAILPRGCESALPVFAGWFPLNGNGEMTDSARTGPVAEGNVGGGTGMICFESSAAPEPHRGA
jgi:D-aminopeptidase